MRETKESCCAHGHRQNCHQGILNSGDREQRIQFYRHRIECFQERVEEAKKSLEEIQKDGGS
jgi:hypothetical protein